MPGPCTHLDMVEVAAVPTRDGVEGCEECLKIGGRWLHLRVCLTCGRVGCCDSSPNRHATKHTVEAGHPLVRSIEPGEDWCWCAVDDTYFVVDLPQR
jgi:hypothetical protein